MASPTNEPIHAGADPDAPSPMPRAYWGPLVLSLLVLLWFYAFEIHFGIGRHQSAFEWLWRAWNTENDFEHGPIFPLLIAGLVFNRFKAIREVASGCNMWGLVVVLAGVLLYAAGFRTLQPRISLGALPIILWGSSLYLWGWAAARLLFLPLFFFWLAIPLPGFQQATTHMQLLATKMAYYGSALFGVETIAQGNMISSAKGSWEPLEIAQGCSGIRSLMALMMISGAWACAADMALWKRALLFLSALPLAILGNALRVVSIFVIAEYGDEKWARTTWHDWSGLLLFYPFSLMLLLGIHSVLEGGLPWKKARRKELRRVVVAKHVQSPGTQPSSSEL